MPQPLGNKPCARVADKHAKDYAQFQCDGTSDSRFVTKRRIKCNPGFVLKYSRLKFSITRIRISLARTIVLTCDFRLEIRGRARSLAFYRREFFSKLLG
jgi:hypothetical protein